MNCFYRYVAGVVVSVFALLVWVPLTEPIICRDPGAGDCIRLDAFVFLGVAIFLSSRWAARGCERDRARDDEEE